MPTVGLAGPHRMCLQDRAGVFRFGDAHRSRGLPSPVIHVQQCDFVAHGGKPCDGAAAAILGVTGMSSYNHELERTRRPFVGGTGILRRRGDGSACCESGVPEHFAAIDGGLPACSI
jgi:hypothetical protein